MEKDNRKKIISTLPGEIIESKKESAFKNIYIGTLNILMPPVAAKYHARYKKRKAGHLIFDTILALVIFVLVALNVFYFTSDGLLPNPELNVSLIAPDEIMSGEKFDAQLLIKNPTESEINNINVSLNPPDGFILLGSDKDLTEYVWNIDRLYGQQGTALNISGAVFSELNETKTLKALINFESGDAAFNKSVSQNIRLTRSVLELSFKSAGSVEGGKIYENRVVIKNNGQIDIADLVLNVSWPSNYLFLSSSEAINEGDAWIIESISPGQEWSLNFSGVSQSATKDQKIIFEFKVYKKLNNVNILQSENSLVVNLEALKTIEEVISEEKDGSKINFVAEAHYYSMAGIQFGYGPLPPKQNMTTGYRIFWVIDTAEVNLKEAQVKASLPNNVVWVGNVSTITGQQVTYDQAARMISWNIGDVIKGQGPISASFEINITPDSKDVGQLVELLGESVLSGYKGKEKQTIIYPALNSDLQESLSRNKGIVVE